MLLPSQLETVEITLPGRLIRKVVITDAWDEVREIEPRRFDADEVVCLTHYAEVLVAEYHDDRTFTYASVAIFVHGLGDTPLLLSIEARS